jgi:hypothetical protein
MLEAIVNYGFALKMDGMEKLIVDKQCITTKLQLIMAIFKR